MCGPEVFRLTPKLGKFPGEMLNGVYELNLSKSSFAFI